MAVHFHTLKIKEIKKETVDCVTILFSIPANKKEIFTFQQGQNIVIKKEINGEELRRNYSICSAPFENELCVAVKKIEGGKFSTFANCELCINDELDVLPPSGNFNTKLDSANTKNYLAVCAGSGITPILSIIKETLKTEPKSTFTLVYGNKNRGSIIFFEELEGLKNLYIQRFNFINILSRERTDSTLHFGRIDQEKLMALEKLIDFKNMDDCFLCGPQEMIFNAKDFLIENGLDKHKIHFELFASNNNFEQANKNDLIEMDTTLQSKITVKLDGRSFDFSLGFNETNILDAALQQGADLPYACKGGVCCTCKAKLLKGNVKMDVNWGLEEEEIEQGFILTCQAHPITPEVVVDFDIK